MQTCDVDSDCGRLNYCDTDENVCVHEDIFPVQALDIIAYIVMGIFLGLQNIGGLGAGTIKIFVFMIILNYSMTESTSLTYAVLFGSKLADNLMAYKRKHPVFKLKPLIDYSITLIFLPSVLLGSVMGAALSPILPNIVLQICLFFFITVSLVKTVQKVKKQWAIRKKQQEQEKLQEKEQDNNAKNSESQKQKEEQTIKSPVTVEKETNRNLVSSSEKQTNRDLAAEELQTQAVMILSDRDELNDKIPRDLLAESMQNSEDMQKEKQQQNLAVQPSEKDLKKYNQLLEDEKKIPAGKLLFILAIFVILFVFYLFLGGKKADSIAGIEMCGDAYWVLYVIQFFIYLAFFLLIKKYLIIQEQIKNAANHMYQLYEVSITKLGMSKFIINGFLCGFIIGLVGFGGSLTIVPIMLALGLHPRAATATTSFLTIFSSAISVITALLGGQLTLEAFGFLFGISFVGSTIFTYIFNKIVEHFKLESLTIAFTAVVQFALLAAVIVLFIISLINQPFSDQLETKDFC